MATVSTNIVAFFFESISGGGQNYGTQDLRTSSSAAPSQYSQGTPGNDIEKTDFTVARRYGFLSPRDEAFYRAVAQERLRLEETEKPFKLRTRCENYIII